jgi:OOP family OmpA-OmpF porin
MNQSIEMRGSIKKMTWQQGRSSANRPGGALLRGLLYGGVMVVWMGSTPLAQQKSPAPPPAEVESAAVERVPAGVKKKVEGVILRRDVDSFVLRDKTAGEYQILLTGQTQVEEKKSNIFRRGRNYGVTSLIKGLNLQVEGRGNQEGALVAEKIRFTDDAFVTAQSVETRVVPVEERVEEAEKRLSLSEMNAQTLSNQIIELDSITKKVRDNAGAAQQTANDALTRVETTNRRIDATNQRIEQLVSGLDDYETKRQVIVQFRVGNASLLPEALLALDEIAAQAKNERAYVIEIMGFASSEGNVALNRRLSQQRADAVVRYLAETHGVPLRRMITPFGYGAARPIADNASREGREQNRRVEVRILVNRALQSPTVGGVNEKSSH